MKNKYIKDIKIGLITGLLLGASLLPMFLNSNEEKIETEPDIELQGIYAMSGNKRNELLLNYSLDGKTSDQFERDRAVLYSVGAYCGNHAEDIFNYSKGYWQPFMEDGRFDDLCEDISNAKSKDDIKLSLQKVLTDFLEYDQLLLEQGFDAKLYFNAGFNCDGCFSGKDNCMSFSQSMVNDIYMGLFLAEPEKSKYIKERMNRAVEIFAHELIHAIEFNDGKINPENDYFKIIEMNRKFGFATVSFVKEKADDKSRDVDQNISNCVIEVYKAFSRFEDNRNGKTELIYILEDVLNIVDETVESVEENRVFFDDKDIRYRIYENQPVEILAQKVGGCIESGNWDFDGDRQIFPTLNLSKKDEWVLDSLKDYPDFMNDDILDANEYLEIICSQSKVSSFGDLSEKERGAERLYRYKHLIETILQRVKNDEISFPQNKLTFQNNQDNLMGPSFL